MLAEKPSLSTAAVLTVAEMYQADRAAMAAGVTGPQLMDAAGFAIAQIVRRWPRQPVAIVCGPGNNGGDGFIAARKLARRGWPVRLSLLGARESLKGDAAWAASLWRGGVEPLSTDSLEGCTLIVDALFGAGLTRPLEGMARAVVEDINHRRHRRLPVVAVDVPSGLSGDTGVPLAGLAIQAAVTVTFFRPKPAHWLLPGRLLCGEVIVADIGIPEAVLEAIAPRIFINGPGLWSLPQPRPTGHKYDRGHVLAVGGAVLTGATRLAVRAARRVGAGLVTIAAPEPVSSLYAQDAPGVMVAPCAHVRDLAELLADPRRNVVLIGPGAGRGANTRAMVEAVLATGRPCVLDADALTSFAEDPAALFARLHPACVLTPHDGESAALFGVSGADRLERARHAARVARAVVLLKGGDTVIAAPDGRAAINTNAPPTLATAGAGDVLAGLTVGLLAQGMDAFAAACAAAWLHGAVATRIGPGLLAEDLPEALPDVLKACPFFPPSP
ncbi:MAG: YjeF family protein [Rhodospirillaceae bacterium]|nr:MAG: YjeF family protein [Rhodospirillaceae bacterium]